MKGANIYALAIIGWVAATGCGSPGDPRDSSSNSAVDDRAVVIDVRTPREYAQAHVAGSTNIPVGEIAERIQQVVPDKSTPVVLHCQTGRRSEIAAELLEAKGYTVRDLGSLANARSVIEGR